MTSPAAPRRALLVGGTFDPIHLGHLGVAVQAAELLAAEQVWLIPTRVSPHRGASGASAVDRLVMVEAAAATDPRMRVLDLELRRPGPSYTAETLAELEQLWPQTEQWFLLGADAARELATWQRLAEVLELARFAIVPRSGTPPPRQSEMVALGFRPDRTRVLDVASPSISGTEVRRRAATGMSLEGLVPAAVAEIIAARGLYRGGAAEG